MDLGSPRQYTLGPPPTRAVDADEPCGALGDDLQLVRRADQFPGAGDDPEDGAMIPSLPR